MHACGQCKARPHPAKVTRAFRDHNFLRIAPHPFDSPGLAPSDLFLFFLFRHLKNRLQGQQFGSADELLSSVRKILDELGVDILKMIFRECINRLNKWIAALQQMESMWNEVNSGPVRDS
jgi:hypothetical protein